jgi:hypothetical protein
MVDRDFILAGDAIFTIELPGSGHHTFRVQYVEANDRWQEAWFVKALIGPDNTCSYAYLGKLNEFTGQVTTTARSCWPQDAFPVRLLNRILARVWSDDHAAYEQHGYKTHHEGRCGRCGRVLTVPSSIESGIGPECAKKMCLV